MFSIKKCTVPANTLLEKYSQNGSYADSYVTHVYGRISLPQFIFAFYTTPLFKLERLILKLLAAKPSTDIHAQQLADGLREQFAAWHVEDRNESELLMCDFQGRTRSWLMAVPVSAAGGAQTQLYFGSAVVPKRGPKTGKSSPGFIFISLLGFHRIYSRLLLYSAKSKLRRLVSKPI